MDYISESDIRKIIAAVIEASEKQTTGTVPLAPVTSDKEAGCVSSAGVHFIVAIGSDHGGYELKSNLIPYIQELGHEVLDCGTHGKESVDYPDFALAVAELVQQKKACRGIVIDAAGIGSAIAANKVPGVRAAMCYDYATARNSREHNHANVLSLGAGLLGLNQVKLIVKTWLETEAGGDRHARRIEKITAIEKKYSKEI